MTEAKPIAVMSGRAGMGDALLVCPLIWEIGRRYPGHPVWWFGQLSTGLVEKVAGLMPERIGRLLQIPKARPYPTGLIPTLRTMPAFHRAFDMRSRFGDVALARLCLRSEAFRFHARLAMVRRAPSVAARNWSLIELDAGQRLDWQEAARVGFAIEAAVEREVDRLLAPGKRHFGIVVTRPCDKAWPVEPAAALARFASEAGFQPVVFSGPAERHEVGALLEAAPGTILAPARFDGEATDRFRLEFAAAAARRMTVAVSPDTGLGHLLGISRVPLVSLFGPTDPQRWAPYAARSAILQAPLQNGSRDMRRIAPDAVMRAALSLL